MFLYRFLIGPIAAFVIAMVLVNYWPVLPIVMKGFISLFEALMVVISFGTLKHVVALKAALKQRPEVCEIEVKSFSARKGPDSFIAEMSMQDSLWRATLAGNKFDRSCHGAAHKGRVWRHPVSMTPLAAEINGRKLAIIPVVLRVNPDGLTEKVIQRFHPKT